MRVGQLRGRKSGDDGSGVEGESSVEVFWSGIVQCFVSVGEDFEGDSLVDWEPVHVFQAVCDMAVAGDV
ncbi:hypothetical protein NDU88_006091 [Pleurodeles waltl]|uniref:Uncharacterized protein n=1 Tax=Pleurodeles waltl TaxID=8319 RepID=A0AAV7LNA2_PLEWA|nr:hypothetical protein NDU88_006091 [Pleurodeles waltl]